MANDKPPTSQQTSQMTSQPTSQTTTQSSHDQDNLPMGQRVKGFFRTIYKVLSSTLGLVIALIIYSFVGAAIFHAIEGSHETIEKTDIIALREQVIDNAWNVSHAINETQETEFADQIRQELKRYEERLHEAFLHGINTDSEVHVWDFWGAFLFCATVYTTIGYGHIAPATKAGRIVTMVYALFGIPLCLIVMAELGKKITIFLKFLWSFVRRFYKTGTCKKIRQAKPIKAFQKTLYKIDPSKKKNNNGEPSKDDTQEQEVEPPPFVVDDDFNLPPVIAIGITVAYICAGAGMYLKWEENWDYLDAFYFIFISISTVGFGDVLPEHPRYFLASSIYILLGLSLVAMVINVIMEVVSDTIDKAKVKVINAGQKIGINLSTEDIDEVGTAKKGNGDPPKKY